MNPTVAPSTDTMSDFPGTGASTHRNLRPAGHGAGSLRRRDRPHPGFPPGHPFRPGLLGPAPVADLGSGPGHVTARLHALGVPVFGIDLSPRMVAPARAAHPGLRFHVGSMTRLDLPDGTLGGVLALYSTIHVPDEHLPTAFAEMRRTLVPGGQVLLGFQSGDSGDEDGRTHLTERYGHEISLDFHRRTPETVCALLAAAGLEPRARVLREPESERKLPRAFILARKPRAA
ncbi:class I SAM-dependent methyltransferase [Streptomyces sp. NPDC004629]|uniref:class I SAM-dependent methyltransferase n=1 Tax=Streptomyces sp. NPDC004629 TaxID=3364705 RepID=UPI0036A4D56D